MLPGILRLRLFVVRYRRPIIGGLLVISLLAAAGAGHAYVKPGTETVTERQHVQDVTASVDSSVVVTGNTTVYERGTRLQNRRMYLRGAGNELTLTGEVAAPNGATVTQQLLVEYRARRGQRIVWKDSHVLGSTTEQIDGENATLETRANISEIDQRLTELRNEFGSAAVVEVQLRHVVDYETDRYDGRLNASSSLELTDRAYIIESHLSADRTHAETSTMTRQQSPEYGLIGALGLLAIVSGLAAGIVTRIDQSVAEASEQLLKQRYAAWISHGRLPIYVADYRVPIDTLADLVNIGVDSNERVIYDKDLDAYGILRDDTLYWYSPSSGSLMAPADPIDDLSDGEWFSLFDGEEMSNDDTDELPEDADADPETSTPGFVFDESTSGSRRENMAEFDEAMNQIDESLDDTRTNGDNSGFIFESDDDTAENTSLFEDV